MTESVSKSVFKAKALELFRQVERTGTPIVITDRGVPVLTLTPFRPAPSAAITVLRESVVEYSAATDAVGAEDWEAAR